MDSMNRILADALKLLKGGNAEQAENEFAKAAAACHTAFGDTNIIMARTLAHLARVRASRGKSDIALSMYERILRIHEQLPVPLNSDHAIALRELAILREENDSQAAADTLRAKADQIMAALSTKTLTSQAAHKAANSSEVPHESSDDGIEDDDDDNDDEDDDRDRDRDDGGDDEEDNGAQALRCHPLYESQTR